jgi:hypothetical protein
MGALVFGESADTVSRLHASWAVGVADVDQGTATIEWRHVPDPSPAPHRDLLLLRGRDDTVVEFVVANRCDGKFMGTDSEGRDVYIYTTRHDIDTVSSYIVSTGPVAPTLMARNFDAGATLLDKVARLTVSDQLGESFPDETPLSLEIDQMLEQSGGIVPCPVQVMRQLFDEEWTYGTHPVAGSVMSIGVAEFWGSGIAPSVIGNRLFYRTGRVFSVAVATFPIATAIKLECGRLRTQLLSVLGDALRYGPTTVIATRLAKIHAAVVTKTAASTAGCSISLANAPPCVMAAINAGFKNQRRWKLAAMVVAVSRLVKITSVGLRDEVSAAIRDSANPNDRVVTWELAVANAVGSKPPRPFPCRLVPGRKKHPNDFFCPHRDKSPSTNAAACIRSRTLNPGAKLDPALVTVRDIMVYTTKRSV